MAGISKNVIGASGIGVIALFYLYQAHKLPFGSAGMPGMGFVPVLVGVALLALCVALIVSDLASPARGGVREADLWEEEEGESESAGYKNPAVITAVMLIYPIALDTLGFVISSAALLFVVLRVMKYRGWLGSLVAAVLTSTVAHLVFSVWLKVYFPKGILG